MNISRRKFVKEVIKRTIPFLGIVVVGPTILSSCSKDEEPLGCNNSCTGTAQSGCGSNCSNSCVGTSANGCGGGCKTTCNLHLAQIVAQIAVADVLRIAKMTAITLPNHPHALVVAIAVIVPVLRIAMIHVELDVTLRARDNAQVLV